MKLPGRLGQPAYANFNRRTRKIPTFSLWLRIQSEGSDTPDEVKATNIKRVTARFTPGKQFKQVLNNTEFVKNGS